MAGETKQTFATKKLDAESSQQEKGPAKEQFNKKAPKGSPERFHNGSLDSQTVNTKFVEKERDNTQQREAVIRPQQAGKIDFKSLQNHSKYTSDRTWPSNKGSPQSPSGKSRNRDKGKKSGKTERGNPQQLYRLSIINPRSNPTIGIAYPQQKVSPPKRLEVSRGPVSGSYRFHVPSIPEREAELQQEELSYNRCFQEGSSNLTSPSYTSQTVGCAAGGPAHQLSPSTIAQQQPGPLETSNTHPASQILFSDFQLSGVDMWQSPDRTFNNASFGVQKTNSVVDVNKPSGFVPLPFQYGYPLLDDSTSDSFACDQNPQPQDFIEASLGSNQVSQSSFSFPSSGEEHEVVQSNTPFNNDKSEDRLQYSLHSKPPPYVHTPLGMPSSVHCTRNMNEDVSKGESSISCNLQSEQNKSALSDKSDTYCPIDTRDTNVSTGGKKGCHSKNATSTQRVLIQGNVNHIRNIAQGQSSQMHFQNKAYSSPSPSTIHMGATPHDKNANKSHSRVAQQWEGSNKAFPSPMDQSSTQYPFQCQPPLEQRQSTGINSRMPWQQIRLTSAVPSQNRIELSRQLSNQPLSFLITPSDWQEDGKSQKSNTQKCSNSFASKRPNEAFPNLRQDNVKQGCGSILPCQFTNKVESNQRQAGDAKNKSVYFGINQTVHASSRTPNYPPLPVPSMGLMMVSPYDSPSHSPIQHPTSSSTCSSLSPDSTSPGNSSSDDSQNSQVPPPQFYHQHQGKASSDSLNSNQHHYHSEVSRTLHYNQDRAKESAASCSSNIRHTKHNMEGGKACMEGYGMEHHPPPPYSAHQLLATANLDQLDVLLTCKQCDQNFNNVASFLDHKQYCGQHTFAQNDFKDVRRVEDSRKFHTDHTKAISSSGGFAMSRSSSDLHLSLLGLSKNGDIIPDCETKLCAKDDPTKLMLPSAPLPDLEMEDAKLDSLITEALNGFCYQSDNSEIDSSFIDAFVDDEITTTKCSSNRHTLKSKDTIMFESRSKHEFTSSEKSLLQEKYSFDSDLDCLSSESKYIDDSHKDSHLELEPNKECSGEQASLVKRESASDESSTQWIKETPKSDKATEESELSPRYLLSRKFSERCGVKSLQRSNPTVKTTIPQIPSATRSPSSQRPVVKDGKRKRTSGGSWSKELIHKIVQQKNKLHKLHVKGTKNMQFSLVMERVTPTVQNPTFREYDYISDSDEDCEPVKIASQGRLSQSIRCKYTYTKGCKGRIRADKNIDSPWKQDKTESFETKKAEAVSPPSVKETPGHQRVRRRSSRSSTSSEMSTSVSISSESISSPKSTDSDCEKREVRKKDQDSFEQERSPQRILKESSTSLALTFTKNTKHYSTDKILLSELKDSYTTSKCSNIISTTGETASEHTLTNSTVCLARFKTTRVEVEEQMDHYGCEIASAEEPTPLNNDYKDHIKANMHLHKPSVTLNPAKTKSEKEANHICKIKKDNALPKGKSLHKKREGQRSQLGLESSITAPENFSSKVSAIKDIKGSPSDLFSEPTSLCSSLIDDVCLSPAKLHDTAPQKDRNCLLPFPLEHDQSIMKSPLSFDTSSMFGDLNGFDNNLYPEIQLTKESFGPIETTTDKKELFESAFSPLLEQRDWSMIVDVTPELPDEIAQYKEDSDITNDKKTSFNAVPFTLTDKIMDYHPNLNSSVSEDELEIKRIVTELESQLQVPKLSSPSSLDNESPKHLTMSKFSPLRLGHEGESEQSTLEVVCPSENLVLATPTGSHSELFSEPELPWSSPVQFGLIGGQQCLHTPTHSSVADTPIHLDQDNVAVKDGEDLKVIPTEKKPALTIEEKTEISNSLDIATEKSEEMIEHEIYTENLMKSLEVISDSLSSGLESPQSLQQKECSSAEVEEKTDEQKTNPKNETETMESTYSSVDLTKCLTNMNKTFLEHPHKFIIQDNCESKFDSVRVTEENTSMEGNDVSPKDIDTHMNELQPLENACEGMSTSDYDESPKDIHTKSPVVMFEDQSCKPSVNQTGTSECGIMEDHNSSSLLKNSDDSTTFQDGLKEDSTVCSKQESDQAEEIYIEPITNKDDKVFYESVSPQHSIEDCENDCDKIETPKDNKDPANDAFFDSIIGSHHSGNAHAHEIQENVTESATIHVQAQPDKNDHSCSAVMEKCTSFVIASPAHTPCEEKVQCNVDKDSNQLDSAPPVSPSPLVSALILSKGPTVYADTSSLTGCWTDVNIIAPDLIEDRPNLKSKCSEDVDIGKSDNCESSVTTTEINNSFDPHMDFGETTQNKRSTPDTVLAVDSISKQTFSEANEKSETLDVPQNRDTLYEFKLSPLNYSETNFSDCSLNTETLNKVMDVQSNIKLSPKDSLDLNTCALTIDTQLSTNCRLSPIHVQNELELTTHDHLVKLDISHFQNTTSQNDKYSCNSPTDHHLGENVASAITEQLSKFHQNTVSTCHVPLDTTDYVDLHMKLLNKADAENVENHITPFKLDALSQSPSVQETLSPKEPLPEVSSRLTPVPTPRMGQGTQQPEVKSSPKKNGTQNSVQGKFQCEMCLMYFRTVPGLKRHKAMKHAIKADMKTVKNPSLSNQGFVYQVTHSGDNELKDHIGILDPAVLLHPDKDGITVSHGDPAALTPVFDSTSNELQVPKGLKTNDKDDVPPVIEKVKKNSKVKRTKSIDISNEGLIHELVKPDPFPEELLNILKTDILQAISPDFPTKEQPECPGSPKTQSMGNSSNSHEAEITEEHQGMGLTCANEHETVTSFPKHPELYSHGVEEDGIIKRESCASLQTVENGQTNDVCKEFTITKEYPNMKEMSKDSTKAVKCEITNLPTDENGTHCESCKVQPLSPSGLGPDLKALFDDESTFSRLFPRNDEMKRKKCARVYGKSNKKQKPALPALVSDYACSNAMFLDKNEEFKEKTEHVFVSNLNDHCEYETISLDDAKMLDMCHKSTLKSSAEESLSKDDLTDHQTGYKDTSEISVNDFLCQTENGIGKPSAHLDGSEDASIERAGSSDSQGDCNTEVTGRLCPLQIVCVQDNVTRYPGIDIQNLNTTFQLPEIQFFEPGRDISLVDVIASNSTEIKEPEKTPKKPTERRGRKRIETGLKPKDKQYKCKVCFTWFLTLGELDFHKLSHNPSPPPTCYMCVQRKFSSREQLRDHLKEKHAKNKAGIWTCGMCLKEISDVWMYNEHLREHATQFARKGQSQSSLLDMPGCFMQENAVKNFISSIMQHRSNKSMKGENVKSSKEERKASVDVPGKEQKSLDMCEPAAMKTKVSAAGGSKHGTFTPLEVLHKAETTPKNIEMHPNCKDPSRDCHHCGKQFPKPFKLQRHLVVHSLQKIFMCHKCPVAFQEAKELKGHLKNEHEEVDELDSKHTTLYTCELCADVMHVIKKSFICSTCNYTFSKKEQFDRHMEKHLAGSNKIFKFKGVVRPCKPFESKDDELDIPPTKRRKVLSESSLESSLDSGIASITSIHISQSTETQGLNPILEDHPCSSADEHFTETNNTSVKIEDEAEDLSGVQELGQCQPQIDPAEHTLPTNTVPKEENSEGSHVHEIQDRDTREVGIDNRSLLAEICDVKIEDECMGGQTTLPVMVSNESSVPEKKMKECTGFGSANKHIEAEDSDLCNLDISDQTSKSMKSQQTVDFLPNFLPNFVKQPSLSSDTDQLRQNQINESSLIMRSETEQTSNQAELPTYILVKDKTSFKSSENIKQGLDNSPKPGGLGTTDAVAISHAKILLSSITGEDKDSIKQKKRKVLKTRQSSPRTVSPATRENLGVDRKVKKKFRPNKCESMTCQRKADGGDYPVLTSVKDDTASNKIVSKHKSGTLDLQPKRGSLDNLSPKKGEMVRHLNGEFRGKKSVTGRSIHSPTSKMSVASMNKSFNKSQHKPGVKSLETHSYRTVESQNNLLSQLFGQRLTGFKIPLRKDTSESMN